MQVAASFLVGLVFGLGLILAGMANPAKVQGFLDIAGLWDPSLAMVMGGAIAVALVPFALARRMPRSLLGVTMSLPTVSRIDWRVVLGSLAFGVGWGLAGFCPGPAIVALGTGEAKAIVFVIAMAAGMGVYELVDLRTRRHALVSAQDRLLKE
ncbi:MAG: YeeE/YedE family protein [Proteobacteria bacterium]|nr:YeeE/YedE family protein [Pseudomonadota bacterium]